MRQDMKVLTSMVTGRWFTPGWYINMVHSVLGFIHLDPASEANANDIVDAHTYFTEDMNGLIRPWEAKTIFLNPPYSKERKATTPAWVAKALDEYRLMNYHSGIVLVNAKLGYNWFNNLIDNDATVVILHRDRMKFVDPKTMEESKPSRQPQASVYIGKDPRWFIEVFGQLGWIIN